MSTWFTSDTHFGHKNIINFTRRPVKDVEEMDALLIKNWNDRIGPDDQVFHFGDFTWYNRRDNMWEVLEQLNGRVTFIVGNHDQTFLKYATEFFDEVTHYKEVRIQGQNIIMCHYPMMEWNGSFRGSWMLHGHSHNLWPESHWRRLDVGVDGHGMKPWSFQEVKAYMNKRPSHDRTIFETREGKNF